MWLDSLGHSWQHPGKIDLVYLERNNNQSTIYYTTTIDSLWNIEWLDSKGLSDGAIFVLPQSSFIIHVHTKESASSWWGP